MSILKLEGIFTITKKNGFGVVLGRCVQKNSIVYDGMYSINLILTNQISSGFPDISIGTGVSTVGVSESDSSLFNWYADEVAVATATYPTTAKWTATFNFTETVTPTEIAITKASHTILFNHMLIASPVEYNSGETMDVEYELTIKNE